MGGGEKLWDEIGRWGDGGVGASVYWVWVALPSIVGVCLAEMGGDNVVVLFWVGVAVSGLVLGAVLVALWVVVNGAGVVCGGCCLLYGVAAAGAVVCCCCC